jgi:putative ABC transport system substrate-binding protein
MRRREFITLLGGATVAWPLAARAQQAERVRHIGVLMSTGADDSEGQARIAAFLDALQQLGWTDGRNVRIDIRWPAGSDADLVRKYAAELVALAPDVILATGNTATAPLQQLTQAVPIVFVVTADPVSNGYVASMARPGGNITGFSFIEFGISGKWLELLKEIAPQVTRVAILREIPTGLGQLGAIQSVAPSFGVELFPVDVRDPGRIERAITEFARGSNGGLIVTAGGLVIVHRELLITLAARHRLPAIYWNRMYPNRGGLISYGPDTIDQYRRAAAYVDRILKGDKPADLPVQAPTKYELVINHREGHRARCACHAARPCRRGHRMNRRDLIALLGSTAAFSWPLGARGQQPRLPSIGFLGTTTASAWAAWKTAFVKTFIFSHSQCSR